ncbi:hypothetical protein EUTSA_v10013261mg [Eutrema salsugineum]|uniref:Uncharacterized protein n=1 Tax=Eutrema salsugineum TaxID=72664 RepID=V4LQT5_EUTSA|nr:UPF0481 protein At3g47200 [Eutrema salsugineum]ESQ42213.1 hypothetical protein EUTSA_v10013261mg [Eutrema salsugineum]
MDPQTQQRTGENSHDPIPTSILDIHRLISEDVIGPKLLRESAGSESCCIARIPQSLARINLKAYEPKIVSIGPYHHGKEHLNLTQQHKRRFLKFFVAKMEEKGIDPQDLVRAVSKLEGVIRGSYSEDLGLDSDTLVEMIVLDGCFILTLFFVVSGKVVYTNLDDPIFRMPWILPSIRADLLLLENQVPYVLLQTLFQTSKLVTRSGLNEVSFEFFDYSLQKQEAFWEKHYSLEAKHLLDLIRKTFVPVPSQTSNKDSYLTILCCSEETQKSSSESSLNDNGFLGFVLSAKKLHLRGIKFRPRKNTDSILDISFSNGVLHIPPIVMDDFTASVFLNCVAFEQLYAGSSNHITSYVAFMACLINEESDAAFLSERRILENYFGTEDEVSRFFKGIGKDVALDLEKSYLAKVFAGVNEYTSKGFHVHCAEFVHTHFDSPWTFASSFAALLLLMFAALQVFFVSICYIIVLALMINQVFHFFCKSMPVFQNVKFSASLSAKLFAAFFNTFEFLILQKDMLALVNM